MVKLDALSSAAKFKVFRQKKFIFFLPLECLNSQLETIVATHLHLFPQKTFLSTRFSVKPESPSLPHAHRSILRRTLAREWNSSSYKIILSERYM